MTWKRTAGAVVVVGVLGAAALVHAQQTQQPPAGASKADAVAALKQSLQQGLAKARQYEWVETTIISLKGEEKSRKQQRCYYGADGKVQKVPLDTGEAAQQAPAGGGGRAGRGGGRLKQQVIENKKEDMAEYMQNAAKLIHGYVPPDPAKIQAAKDAGRVKVTPQGSVAEVVISEYQLPGDSMTIKLDPTAGRLLGLGVNSYLDKKEDTVTLDVQMNTLPDGALYAGQSTLDVKAKNIRVVIQNSGHKPMAR